MLPDKFVQIHPGLLLSIYESADIFLCSAKTTGSFSEFCVCVADLEDAETQGEEFQEQSLTRSLAW